MAGCKKSEERNEVKKNGLPYLFFKQCDLWKITFYNVNENTKETGLKVQVKNHNNNHHHNGRRGWGGKGR